MPDIRNKWLKYIFIKVCDCVMFFFITIIVKPDELVQLKPFEETDCLKSFKFIYLSIKNI